MLCLFISLDISFILFYLMVSSNEVIKEPRLPGVKESKIICISVVLRNTAPKSNHAKIIGLAAKSSRIDQLTVFR